MADVHMPDDATIRRIAQRIHEQYLAHQRKRQDSSHPAMRPWDELTEELRGQNLAQARHNVVKLASIGYAVVHASEVDATSTVELSSDDVERLARDEHDRWANEKRANGYVWGRERCDTPPDLTHPDLIAWSDMDDEAKEKDREPVRQMAARFAEAGLALVRLDEV